MSNCTGWKVTAIVSLILLVLLLSITLFGMILINTEEKQYNQCATKYINEDKARDFEVLNGICYLYDEYYNVFYAEVLE